MWVLSKAEEESKGKEVGGGEGWFFQYLLWETFRGLNVELLHTDLLSSLFFLFIFVSAEITYSTFSLLQQLTHGPYILYGPMRSWEVCTCVTAHFKRVIVFYIYHETHKAIERRVCGWKSSGHWKALRLRAGERAGSDREVGNEARVMGGEGSCHSTHIHPWNSFSLLSLNPPALHHSICLFLLLSQYSQPRLCPEIEFSHGVQSFIRDLSVFQAPA